MLPGTGYDEEALQKVATEAEAYADPSLMAVAWEVWREYELGRLDLDEDAFICS